MAQPAEVPAGYTKLMPFLAVTDARAASDFYTRAFGAVERFTISARNGESVETVLDIGPAAVIVTDALRIWPGAQPSATYTDASVLILYVADVDDAFRCAVEAGGSVIRAVSTLLLGERVGLLGDPFGHIWMLATRVEDLTPDEIQRRLDDA